MEQTQLLYKGRYIPFSCLIDVAWSLEPSQKPDWRRIFGVVRWNLNALFVMAQALLGVFSWKFRAITSNRWVQQLIKRCSSQRRKVEGCFRGVFYFGLVFFFSSASFNFHPSREKKNVDHKDLSACWVSPRVLWEVALSAGVGWKQSAFLQLAG